MPTVFLSYPHDSGQDVAAIASFADRLRHALLAAAHHLDVEVHQDLRGVGSARGRGDALGEAVERGAVMVPLVSPAYLRDPRCRAELRTFARRVTEAGYLNRIVPVIWRPTPQVEQPGADDVARLLHALPAIDFSELRFEPPDDPGPRAALTRVAEAILGCLDRQLDTLPPEGVSPPAPDDAEADADLAALLRSMFTPRELRLMLLRMEDGESLALAVDNAAPATPAEVAAEVVATLRRFGRLDALFFHQLRRSRPFRRREIEEIARRYGG